MKLKNILLSGILASSLVLGCTKFDDNPKSYELTNIYETALGQGYERPGGLLVNNIKKFSKGEQNLEAQVFCTSPVFNFKIQKEFLVNPKIYTNSTDLVSQNTLFELSNLEVSDFLASLGEDAYVNGELGCRPVGLILDLLTLPDNSILLSSNISNKLYRVYNDKTGYKQEVYLQDSRLIGITDMILGSDKNIHAVENITKHKKAISIDVLTKKITEEFLIPDGISESMGTSIIGKIDIIENTSAGRALNNSKYYVLDQLTKTIYNVSDDKTLTVLIDKLRYPSSLAIDKVGRVITTLGATISLPDRKFLEYPQVIAINPQTLEQIVLYTFSNENLKDYTAGLSIGDNTKVSPLSFYMTSILQEDVVDWKFYYTKSLTGQIGKLTATKIVTP